MTSPWKAYFPVAGRRVESFSRTRGPAIDIELPGLTEEEKEILPSEVQYLDMNLPARKALMELAKKAKEYEKEREALKSGTSEKQVQKTLSDEILSDPAMSRATSRGENLDTIERQAQGVRGLEGELEELKAIPREFDMTGAAALVTALNGGDPTKFVKAPPTPFDRKQLEIKLQELIQRRKESEAINQLKAIFGQKVPQQPVAYVERGQTQQQEQVRDRGNERAINLNLTTQSATPPPSRGGSGKEEKGLIKAQQYQMTEAAANVYRELGEYADILEKTGYVVAGKDARNLEEKKSRVLGAVGKAENMGVLHKYDMERIDNFLGNATGIMGPLRGLVKGGAKADVAAVRDYRKTLRDRAKGYTESLRGEFPTRVNDINALEGRFDAADAGRGGSPVGTIKAGRGGISYKKIKPGPDSDKSAWEPVK